jgi:hypothetical protein
MPPGGKMWKRGRERGENVRELKRGKKKFEWKVLRKMVQ